jgi:hypothetical protein
MVRGYRATVLHPAGAAAAQRRAKSVTLWMAAQNNTEQAGEGSFKTGDIAFQNKWKPA